MSVILEFIPLKANELHYQVANPFIFLAHHHDYYPAGNSAQGVDSRELKGRNPGSDFVAKDGFRMYHGTVVPGFPSHPHRGFETVTISLNGWIDHFDSLGQRGRYGFGDVQWMTAGAGMQHSEMFPLVNDDKPNTVELFQLWLNLPRARKMVKPAYEMFWAKDIPVVARDGFVLKIIAGDYFGLKALTPPQNSYAADPASQIGIFLLELEAGAKFTMPAKKANVTRQVFLYQGEELKINGENVAKPAQMVVKAEEEIVFAATPPTKIFIIEAVPLNEPIVAYGPFVMNTEQEIKQAYSDYQRTRFGGWPFAHRDEVNPRTEGHFALFADGSRIEPK